MSYKVVLSEHFIKEAKRLSKKYNSLKTELSRMIEVLEQNPTHGIAIGNNVYKIRLAISSKGKGKTGGGRVITYVMIDDNTVLLLAIYNKGDKDTISDNEIRTLLKKYGI